MNRKSDGLVVPGKLANNASIEVAESVEGRGPTKSNSQQCAPGQTQRRRTGLSRLLAVRQLAQRNKKQTFNNLFSLMDEALLTTSFYQLKRQSAAGCDGVTWQAYQQALTWNINTLVHKLREGRYRPKPARRVFIPKEDGSQRPLSIICLEDKIVQQAVVTILNQIYETDFLGLSYGFRPGRGQHDALDALTAAIKRNRVNWVLDLDISKFFDTIEHDWMLRFVAHRVADKRVLRLLTQWLKVGALDEHGHRVTSHIGSPQGAVISPLLANIYLHYAFDLWSNKYRKACRGRVSVVRYADDVVLGFERKEDAEQFLVAAAERMQRFGLRLHPEKTKLLPFGSQAAKRAHHNRERGSSFDFLGFSHYMGRTRRGWFTVMRKTKRSRAQGQLRQIWRELKGRRLHRPIGETGAWLRKVVMGHMNYYAVPHNLQAVGMFICEVRKAWLRALRRRSQRQRMQWERLKGYLALWIPSPRVMHPYPDERFDVRTRGRSRMR